MRPVHLMGCQARGVIDHRQPVGRCDAEHDGFGMVEDLAEGDGGCRRAGQKVGGCLGHLPELVWGEVGGWPGQEGGHVQPSQRGHVQAVESCQPPLSLAGQVHDLGIVAHQHVPLHDALARCWLGPILPAVGHLDRQTHPALRAMGLIIGPNGMGYPTPQK